MRLSEARIYEKKQEGNWLELTPYSINLWLGAYSDEKYASICKPVADFLNRLAGADIALAMRTRGGEGATCWIAISTTPEAAEHFNEGVARTDG